MRNGAKRAARLAASVIATAVVASACSGGAEYQYLESEDGHAFAKIPSEWTVTREGTVAWALLNEQNPSLGFVAGDDTTPWRAVFTAANNGGFDTERPAGLIEVQHIDARMRDNFQVDAFLRTVPSFSQDGANVSTDQIEILDRKLVQIGDLEGFRVRLAVDGLGRNYDQLILTDDERRAFYLISLSCSEECLERHAADIEEIITTFRVES